MSALRELVFILKAQKLTLAVVLISAIVLSCLNMSVPYSLKMAVDTIKSGQNLQFLYWIAAGVMAIYVAKNAVYYFSKSRIVLLAERVAYDLRNRMMAHLHLLSVSYYKRQKPAKLSSRLIQDVESVKEFISSEMIKLTTNGLQILVAVVIIFMLNPLLAVIAVSLLPLNIFIYMGFRGAIARSARAAKEQVSDISGDLVEQFSGVETVKSAASEWKEREKFASSMRVGMSAQIQERRFYLLQKVSADVLVGMSLVLLFAVGGYLLIAGKLETGEFVALYTYMGMLYPLATEVVADAGKFSATTASVDRVYEILRTAPDIRESAGARPRLIEKGRIEFRNVGFSYGGQQVLRDVSFTIEPAEHVLISGPSGCGKSTLLNLIPRFYDCQSGSILIDGVDVKDFTLASLRGQIGVVFQECFLFNSTVLENIRYGRPDATDAEVVHAAEQAQVHAFVQELPEGYLTRIGEGGVPLSFGERQRIGIARAILKDPSVFILDEALASLDAESRASIAEDIQRITQDRTLFIVSQSPSLFADVDKKLVFENGTVKVISLAKPA